MSKQPGTIYSEREMSRKAQHSYSIHETIRALYLVALGREPDQAGLEHYTTILKNNPNKIHDICADIYNSQEHRQRILGLPSIRDHSQYGEFRILLRHFVNSATQHQIVVDVGANGRERSNSYDLMENFGWRGILIEANPALWQEIEKQFAHLNFSLVRNAVSDTEGTFPFYLGINSDVSSLGQCHAAAWGDVQGEIQVNVRRLGSILDEQSIPKDFDLLSLDIEGFDIAVLNDLAINTDYRPKLIIIETSMNFTNKSLNDIPFCEEVKCNYILSDQTVANMILVRI